MSLQVDVLENRDCVAGLKELDAARSIWRLPIRHSTSATSTTPMTTAWKAKEYLDWCRQWTGEAMARS